ncbi:unnamed protein product [Trichogramma brassicae]|uniref:Uncharacterized protein n=1 Tax=Trichogramma brassicae TaxID=86971 RepID=A0A6H5IFU3_9HYME|nr:unnamed protein product [Trichogramma brassicae]
MFAAPLSNYSDYRLRAYIRHISKDKYGRRPSMRTTRRMRRRRQRQDRRAEKAPYNESACTSTNNTMRKVTEAAAARGHVRSSMMRLQTIFALVLLTLLQLARLGSAKYTPVYVDDRALRELYPRTYRSILYTHTERDSGHGRTSCVIFKKAPCHKQFIYIYKIFAQRPPSESNYYYLLHLYIICKSNLATKLKSPSSVCVGKISNTRAIRIDIHTRCIRREDADVEVSKRARPGDEVTKLKQDVRYGSLLARYCTTYSNLRKQLASVHAYTPGRAALRLLCLMHVGNFIKKILKIINMLLPLQGSRIFDQSSFHTLIINFINITSFGVRIAGSRRRAHTYRIIATIVYEIAATATAAHGTRAEAIQSAKVSRASDTLFRTRYITRGKKGPESESGSTVTRCNCNALHSHTLLASRLPTTTNNLTHTYQYRRPPAAELPQHWNLTSCSKMSSITAGLQCVTVQCVTRRTCHRRDFSTAAAAAAAAAGDGTGGGGGAARAAREMRQHLNRGYDCAARLPREEPASSAKSLITILDIQFRDARQSSRQLDVLSFPPLCARTHIHEISLVSVTDTLHSSTTAQRPSMIHTCTRWLACTAAAAYETFTIRIFEKSPEERRRKEEGGGRV